MTLYTHVTTLIPKKGEKNNLSDDIKHVMVSHIVLGAEEIMCFSHFPN